MTQWQNNVWTSQMSLDKNEIGNEMLRFSLKKILNSISLPFKALVHIREENNRLTGWTFAYLVNYFAHSVNWTCPLPKTAHLVNYLIPTGKWAPQLSKLGNLGVNLCKPDQPKVEYSQNTQFLKKKKKKKKKKNLSRFSLLDINTPYAIAWYPWNPVFCSRR